MSKNSVTAYHGTAWELPLFGGREAFDESMIFDGLQPDPESDLGAVFFSDALPVTDFFGERKVADPDTFVQATLRGTVNTSNIYQCRMGSHGLVTLNNTQYDFSCEIQRAALYRAAREAGYDGFMLVDEYRHATDSGSDIAMFSDRAFVVESARLKVGNHWTGWMSREKALSAFVKWGERAYGAECQDHWAMAL